MCVHGCACVRHGRWGRRTFNPLYPENSSIWEVKRSRAVFALDILGKFRRWHNFFLNGDPVWFELVTQLKVRNPVGDGVVIELFGTTRSVMDAVGGASSNFIPLFFPFFFFLRKLVMCSRANFTGELSRTELRAFRSSKYSRHKISPYYL